MENIKTEAMRLIDSLPPEATWDDIIYQMYVKKKIEKGIRAADEGRVVSHEDVRSRLIPK